MAGRSESGEFKTARTKIYPAGLNRVLADAVHKYVHDVFSGSATTRDLPPGFSPFLANAFVADDTVQPDYHGG